jgi:hypothetical protein
MADNIQQHRIHQFMLKLCLLSVRNLTTLPHNARWTLLVDLYFLGDLLAPHHVQVLHPDHKTWHQQQHPPLWLYSLGT